MMYAGALFLLLVMAALIWLVRKYMLAWMKDVPLHGTGFTLAELRDLHRNGAMTEEEFERAKKQLLQVMQIPKKSPQTPPASSQNHQNP